MCPSLRDSLYNEDVVPWPQIVKTTATSYYF